MLAPGADAAQVTVEPVCAPAAPCGTGGRFAQICFNLMEKTPSSTICPAERCSSPSAGTGTRCWRWPTPGIGIPEEELPKAFNRFTGWTRPAPGPRGHRPGLSIVRDTAPPRGWITAQRRQPEGSVFTAGFPARPRRQEVSPWVRPAALPPRWPWPYPSGCGGSGDSPVCCSIFCADPPGGRPHGPAYPLPASLGSGGAGGGGDGGRSALRANSRRPDLAPFPPRGSPRAGP